MLTDKNALWGNTAMIVLKLLEKNDMYGYQIIDEIYKKSGDVFNLKTGTLYPILHTLERDGMVSSYDETAENQRVRKYYQLTSKGKKMLETKESEWQSYVIAVNRLLGVGDEYALAR